MTAAVLSAAGVLCGKKTKCRKMVKNICKIMKNIRKMVFFLTCRSGRIVLRKRYDNGILAFLRIARLSV
jgi:hypothetical protein